MQLDINLRWATFQYFPNRDGNPDTSKLYDDFLPAGEPVLRQLDQGLHGGVSPLRATGNAK